MQGSITSPMVEQVLEKGRMDMRSRTLPCPLGRLTHGEDLRWGECPSHGTVSKAGPTDHDGAPL